MFGTVSGYVYAQLFCSDSATIRDLQSSQQVVKYKCTDLKHTVLSARHEEVLVLSSSHILVDSEVEWRARISDEGPLLLYNSSGLILESLFSNPVLIFVSLLPCPLGFLLSDKPEGCDCHPQLRKYDLSCNIDDILVTYLGPR